MQEKCGKFAKQIECSFDSKFFDNSSVSSSFPVNLSPNCSKIVYSVTAGSQFYVKLCLRKNGPGPGGDEK